MEVAEGPDGRPRCWWCLGAPDYVEYHDRVWGRPTHGERELFEMLTLEAFQSGLSWLTILRKQAEFGRAFDGWDVDRIARYGESDIQRLVGDRGIVRHRGKIEAAVANARAVRALHDRGQTLHELVWSFAPERGGRRIPRAGHELPTVTAESKSMAEELRSRGFRFVGPTTAYSLMQAAGLVNDHLAGCDFRD